MVRRSATLWMAAVGVLCALTGGGAANLTLQKGQEFVYGGTVKFAMQVANQSPSTVKFAVKERRLVTEVTDAGSKVVVVQELTPDEKDAVPQVGLRTAEIGADGTEKSSAPSKFQPESPEYFPTMPMSFPREVQAGAKWQAREKIGFLKLPPVTFEVTYRVAGEEKVGDVACWKVEKTLNETLPSTRSVLEGTAEMTFESFTERFYVGKSQPLLARWERAMQVAFKQGSASARYEHTWDLALQSQQTLPAEELTSRTEQLKALQSIEEKLTVTGFKDAETAVNEFKSKYSNSPYQAFIPLAAALINDLKLEASRPKTGPFSVVLTELNSGKKMSLFDLRGKIILVNFFASW